ncbi:MULTISPECIES: hypothetical protein [unclassified Blastococcus]
MTRALRPDFATASVGLTLPAQHKNLARLHDWLLDEVGLLEGESVLATTNYQQGSFGRLPNHVLLVTNKRIAFTHDGGVRSIPLSKIDTSRIGLKAGMINGELTLQTDAGESLHFKKGVSLSIQEVAQLIIHSADGERMQGAPTQRVNEAPTAARSGAADNTAKVTGSGNRILRASVTGVLPIRIEHFGSEHIAVWEITEAGDQGDLLLNTIGRYSGTFVCAQQGPLSGFEVSADGGWSLEFVGWDGLKAWDGIVRGANADVLRLANPARGLMSATLTYRGNEHLAVWAHGMNEDLLVNHVGACHGQIRIPPGTEFLTIDTVGPWEAALD